MKKVKQKQQRKPLLAPWFAFVAVLMAALTVGNGIAIYYDNALRQVFGEISTSDGNAAEAGETYYSSIYTSKTEEQQAARDIVESIVQEGTVLLKNENAVLPLSNDEKANKVSIFGGASVNLVYGGAGSANINTDNARNLKDSMEDAGFEVNDVLWNFYKEGAAKDYVNSGTESSSAVAAPSAVLNEAPQSIYTAEVKKSYEEYSDAAIVVFSRSAGEGVDITRNMSAYNNDKKKIAGTAQYEEGQHYLELTQEEKELLQEVGSQFEKVIVLLNTTNPMELGFLDDETYGVDACLWIGALGETGTNAVADILAGKVNPSGHLTDTYVYDNFSAPATVNMGEFNYTGTDYYYTAYEEGIYVGYKYYETRYEDVVKEQGNAGAYDYAATVKYPFGYGLSYTQFAWSDFSVTAPNENGVCEATVTVTNVGETAGKDVVELYYQAPYTSGGTEKASVNLLQFAKTDNLEPGESQTLTMNFELADMASYDATEQKTYTLDEGDYYITVSENAHQALNQILAYEEYENIDMLFGEPDASFVMSYQQDEPVYYTESSTGYTVTNRFDKADISNESCEAYDENYTYLSRADWEGTFPSAYADGTGEAGSDNIGGYVYTKAIGNDLKDTLDAKGYEASLNEKSKDSYEMPATGNKNDLELIDLIGHAYEDELWDSLLDEVTVEEMAKLIQRGGYNTQLMESINKPKTYDFDGTSGLSSFTAQVDAVAFPIGTLIATTWNTQLQDEYGEAIGEECLWSTEGSRENGVNGWYAPGMNIHRTPFSGRNFEYYSEDGTLSGLVGKSVVSGVQRKGIYCYIKHFALNDQEQHRDTTGLIVWANEQSIRELYLKPFQMTLEATENNGPVAIMSSFNRIGVTWAGGNYNLLTEVARNEWGFHGLIITDYINNPDYMVADQVIAAGGDVSLTNGNNQLSETESPAMISLMREATRHVLYTVSQSTAMNGVVKGANVKEAIPVYAFMLFGIDAVAVLIVVLISVKLVKRRKRFMNEQKGTM